MEKIKNWIFTEPTLFCYRRVWRFAGDRRPFVVLGVALSGLNQVVALMTPLIVALLINTIQDQGVNSANFMTLVYISLGLLGITVARWSLHFPARIIERRNAFLFEKNYRLYLMQNILDLPLAWHGDRDSGDTIDKVNKATESLHQFTQKNFQILRVIVALGGSCIALAFFHIYLALGAIVFGAVVFSILYRFDRKLIPQYGQLNILSNRISAVIFDSLSNITSVVILKIRDRIIADLRKNVEKPYGLFMKNTYLNEFKWLTGSLTFEVGFVAALIFFLYSILERGNVIQVGTITALIMYLQRIGDSFFAFAGLYEEIIRSKTDIKNVEEIENDFLENSVRAQKIHVKSRILVKNLIFSYGDQASSHLNSISLTIQKGERIALIGASGSGKTTFLKVLHGLYQNVLGEIIIDGKKLEKPLDQINLGTTLVPQEPELFSASIKENITLGTTCTKKQLQHIMDLARFSEVVVDLPHGVESKVNEKGVNLSGGQKQRLALARALHFAQGKQVILLDESTSSVDPTNELKIYEGVFEEFKDTTIIASIHKLHLLKLFDRIVMFDGGKIVGDGTFDDLLTSHKSFKKQWEAYNKGQ